MREIKKGIHTKENTQTQENNNRIMNYCLLVITTGLALFLFGCVKENDKAEYIGIGMASGGCVMHVATLTDDTEEDEEDE